MNAILRCTESNNDYFTKGRSYLFFNGMLTCDDPSFGTNLYFTPKTLAERKDALINTLEDIHNYFSKYHYNVQFNIDNTTTNNCQIAS